MFVHLLRISVSCVKLIAKLITCCSLQCHWVPRNGILYILTIIYPRKYFLCFYFNAKFSKRWDRLVFPYAFYINTDIDIWQNWKENLWFLVSTINLIFFFIYLTNLSLYLQLNLVHEQLNSVNLVCLYFMLWETFINFTWTLPHNSSCTPLTRGCTTSIHCYWVIFLTKGNCAIKGSIWSCQIGLVLNITPRRYDFVTFYYMCNLVKKNTIFYSLLNS